MFEDLLNILITMHVVPGKHLIKNFQKGILDAYSGKYLEGN